MDLKQNIIIESLGFYLPPESVTTGEMLAGCKNKIQFPLENVTGIKSRRMAGQHEFSIDLARNSIADCLAKSKYDPIDIHLLICCNISRYDDSTSVSFEPCTSSRLRQEFGFTNALAFDIANACAGMFTGIYIANSLINNGTINRAMVVSGEYITHISQSAQKEIESFMDSRLACLTLGDAGAALILEQASDEKTGFQKFDLQTLGGYSQYCIAKPTDHGGWIMYTDSVNLTDVAVKAGSKHAISVMESAKWQPEEFQHLIMHQTSGMTLNSAKREINRLLNKRICNGNNTVNNLEQRGNTASTSHFVAVADHIYNNNINSGDKIVFSISASGLTIGTSLYVFDDLPDRLREMEAEKSHKQKEIPAKGLKSSANSMVSRIRIESMGTIQPGTCLKKNSLDLLFHAATNCLGKSAYDRNNIGLLIYSGVYRTGYIMEPAIAALLAGELDMNAKITEADNNNNNTLAFDIFNGSIGFLNACYVSQQMIAAGRCETAMVVAAEIENNADSFPDRLMHIRETASALIVDRSDDKGFSRFLFKQHGEFSDAYTTSYKMGDAKPFLHVIKDPNLQEMFVECIYPAVQELLQLEGLDLRQINKVFPPQISSDFISRLSERLNLHRDRFIDIVGEGPDLFSSSLIYSFEHAIDKGLVKSGDIGLVITVGSGIQVGCAIYHF